VVSNWVWILQPAAAHIAIGGIGPRGREIQHNSDWLANVLSRCLYYIYIAYIILNNIPSYRNAALEKKNGPRQQRAQAPACHGDLYRQQNIRASLNQPKKGRRISRPAGEITGREEGDGRVTRVAIIILLNVSNIISYGEFIMDKQCVPIRPD
jgi:hypothetical protein